MIGKDDTRRRKEGVGLRGGVGLVPRGREASRLARSCPAMPCNQLAILVYTPPLIGQVEIVTSP
jgi:hypothetical protein